MSHGNKVSMPGELEGKLQQICELSERYRDLYFGKKLGRQEIVEARAVMAEIRNHVLGMQQQWDESIKLSPGVDEVSKTLRSLRLRVDVVSKLVITLANISTFGFRVLSCLDEPVSYVSHFQRQCNLLKDTDASIIQEDADELRSSIECVVRSLRNDIESKKVEIEIVGLYAQTVLAGRIGLFTIILTVLAIVVGVLALL